MSIGAQMWVAWLLARRDSLFAPWLIVAGSSGVWLSVTVEPDETPLAGGGRRSYAAKRSPLLEEDRRPPEGSKFPMRVATKPLNADSGRPPTTRRWGGGPT